LIELVADQWKLSHVFRRPDATRRVGSIGVWLPLLHAIAVCAIFTNLTLFGVASNQLSAVFPSLFAHEPLHDLAHGAMPRHHHEMAAGKGRYVVLVLVCAEHVLLLTWLLAELLLTSPPRWVRVTLKRRKHEAAASKLA